MKERVTRVTTQILAWLSLAMVLNVAWLHAAAGLGVQESAPVWMRAAWSVSVPYFFVVSMGWMAARWKGISAAFKSRVRSLLVPYFLWCWLGALWSITMHGLQLKGWSALRYLGLQPGWDPAYQPMWFLKALFVVLMVEAVFIWLCQIAVRSVRTTVAASARSPSQANPRVLAYVFPLYVLHSLFLSVFKYFGAVNCALARAVFACAASAVTAWLLRKALPRVAAVLFGGR